MNNEQEAKLRVWRPDGSSEDFDANQVNLGPDGSLVLVKVSQKVGRVAGANGQVPVEMTSIVRRVIRRDLWTEVETVEAGVPVELRET